MTNAELQEAIDKTRAWLDTTKCASSKARDDAVAALTELQKIQCTRAAMAHTPTVFQPGISLTTKPTDPDWFAGGPT